MKTGLALTALLALTACSRGPRPRIIMLDDARSRPAKTTPADEERKARDAIRDIEDRIQSGDLPRIEFEPGKDEIALRSYPTLDSIAQLLLSSDHLKLMVKSYTDDAGAEAANLDLSLRRAQAVLGYLVDKGVPPPSMRFHGYGSAHPIADNATEAGRAKNRRVELSVTTRGWNAVY